MLVKTFALILQSMLKKMRGGLYQMNVDFSVLSEPLDVGDVTKKRLMNRLVMPVMMTCPGNRAEEATGGRSAYEFTA